MATLLNIVAAIIFFCVITKGYCGCDLSSITVNQTRAGTVGGKTEWKVTLSNTCICPQSQVKLACNGFQTVEPVDPKVLAVSDDGCILNNGDYFPGFTNITFKYAWDNQFSFAPIYSQIACS